MTTWDKAIKLIWEREHLFTAILIARLTRTGVSKEAIGKIVEYRNIFGSEQKIVTKGLKILAN